MEKSEEGEAKQMEKSEEGEAKQKEGEIAKQKKLLEDKKRAVSYLKARAEALDHLFAVNYANGNYTLAAHDAKRVSAIMEVLGDIDIAS